MQVENSFMCILAYNPKSGHGLITIFLYDGKAGPVRSGKIAIVGHLPGAGKKKTKTTQMGGCCSCWEKA